MESTINQVYKQAFVAFIANMLDEHFPYRNFDWKHSLLKSFRPCIKMLLNNIAQSSIKLGRQKIKRLLDVSMGLPIPLCLNTYLYKVPRPSGSASEKQNKTKQKKKDHFKIADK